jgi:hypothetical protein
MAKSPEVGKVDEIAAAIHAVLKPRGFKKKSRTFNRITADGITQVQELREAARPGRQARLREIASLLGVVLDDVGN